ncbi:hypothetical protein HY251_21740 [bacterium]|nr:hypothetical protein [bacterium]
MRSHEIALLLALAVCVHVVVLLVQRRKRARAVIPALEMEDGAYLELASMEARAPRARRLALTVGGGEAILTLEDAGEAVGPGPGFSFGKATLEARDRESGARFLDAVSRWLERGAPPPREPPGALLAPFALGYVVLGEKRGFRAQKLFLETPRRAAEVFLNVSHDGTRARLLEKDDAYREDLLAILAEVLRDGAPS